jgi:hypothetical protein
MNELQILTIFTSKGQTNYPEVEAIISLTESALASLLPSLASIKSRSMQYNGRKTINNYQGIQNFKLNIRKESSRSHGLHFQDLNMYTFLAWKLRTLPENL